MARVLAFVSVAMILLLAVALAWLNTVNNSSWTGVWWSAMTGLPFDGYGDEESRPPERLGDCRGGTTPREAAHGLALPVNTYPLFENALRARDRRGLADRFAHGHGVAVTDLRGGVIDLVVFTEADHTAEDAIRAGIAIGSHHPLARRVVLLSVLDRVDLTVPNELEVEMWHAAAHRCSRVGLELAEWIVASGEVFRSLALTVETEHVWRSG